MNSGNLSKIPTPAGVVRGVNNNIWSKDIFSGQIDSRSQPVQLLVSIVCLITKAHQALETFQNTKAYYPYSISCLYHCMNMIEALVNTNMCRVCCDAVPSTASQSSQYCLKS